MKINVITVDQSDFTYKLLNLAKRHGVEIDTLGVVRYPFLRKLRILRNMYLRRIGLLPTIPLILHRLERDNKSAKKSHFLGKPLVRDYSKLARRIILTSDEKDPGFLESFSKNEPDFLLLGQMGPIRGELIRSAKIATLNAHGAWLPEYRGTDVLFWTLYFKQFERVGYTIHTVNEGIDTGDIIKFVPVPLENTDTADILFERIKDLALRELLRVAVHWEKESATLRPQKKSDGRNYYVMPQSLRKSAELHLRQHLASEQKLLQQATPSL